MKRFLCALAGIAAANAFAWGGDGHSVIAELAQRRMSVAARAEVESLLGPGASLASISNWADDHRPANPETGRWHFINFSVKEMTYDRKVVCEMRPDGDCILNALDRARATLTCPASEAARREALKFAVHLIGDLHQPLHTITEDRGGNLIRVTLDVRAASKCPQCTPNPRPDNLHSVWDSGLISNSVWNWGALVVRVEGGWLASPESKGADEGTVEDWMLASHRTAGEIWGWLPEDRIIGDEYFRKAIPVIDRQLGLAGLRLARFLNETLPAARRRASCD